MPEYEKIAAKINGGVMPDNDEITYIATACSWWTINNYALNRPSLQETLDFLDSILRAEKIETGSPPYNAIMENCGEGHAFENDYSKLSWSNGCPGPECAAKQRLAAKIQEGRATFTGTPSPAQIRQFNGLVAQAVKDERTAMVAGGGEGGGKIIRANPKAK